MKSIDLQTIIMWDLLAAFQSSTGEPTTIHTKNVGIYLYEY